MKQCLFHIQDDDRPMYVLAVNWTDALSKWRKLIVAENDDDEVPEPRGIHLIARSDDLIL